MLCITGKRVHDWLMSAGVKPQTFARKKSYLNEKVTPFCMFVVCFGFVFVCLFLINIKIRQWK